MSGSKSIDAKIRALEKTDVKILQILTDVKKDVNKIKENIEPKDELLKEAKETIKKLERAFRI